MSNDLQTTIYTDDKVRVCFDKWDDGGAWLSIARSGASMYTALTRSEAEQLLAGLQAILAKEVTA
jgi:hypothetical protein